VVCWSGTVTVDQSYSIGAGASASYHVGSLYNGVVTYNVLSGAAINVTLLGAVNFPSGFFLSELNSTIVAVATVNYVNPGFATSTPKGQAVYNSIINAGGNNIPGDQAPLVSNGGFFF
jgi:hypothetical protein